MTAHLSPEDRDELARLRAAIDSLVGEIKQEADADWTAHSVAADMRDDEAANLHWAVGEVRGEIASALRRLLLP